MARVSTDPNKSNQIYFTVLDEIISGKYPGGTFLIENDLCKQFSVSRTPVREALIRLAQDSFVNLIPNRGAMVPYVTINDIVEVYQLRAANDGLAAYLAAQSHTENLLARMEESVTREERMLEEKRLTPLEISREDFVFHDLLSKHCSNKRLVDILTQINNQMHRIARAAADHYALETLEISVGFHRQAVDAIRRGDSPAAQTALEEHWKAMLHGYIKRSVTGTLPLGI